MSATHVPFLIILCFIRRFLYKFSKWSLGWIKMGPECSKDIYRFRLKRNGYSLGLNE